MCLHEYPSTNKTEKIFEALVFCSIFFFIVKYLIIANIKAFKMYIMHCQRFLLMQVVVYIMLDDTRGLL